MSKGTIIFIFNSETWLLSLSVMAYCNEVFPAKIQISVLLFILVALNAFSITLNYLPYTIYVYILNYTKKVIASSNLPTIVRSRLVFCQSAACRCSSSWRLYGSTPFQIGIIWQLSFIMLTQWVNDLVVCLILIMSVFPKKANEQTG